MVAKNLVSELDSIRVISGCSSIQGLIKELSMQQTFKSGAVENSAQGFMVSDEFESFLTDDPKALTYLTALHNTHEHEESWKKRLKGSPLEELRSPCLTLLVASNEALFESMVRQKDIEGGFIARTFIVYESQRKRVNPLMYSDEQTEKLLKADQEVKVGLVYRLRQITQLSGQMRLSMDATRLYSHWYDALANKNQEDRTGTLDRLGDQVLKVAMLISISEEDNLLITENHLQEAIMKAEECLVGTRRISMESNTSDISPLVKKVLDVFIDAPKQEVTRQKLMTKTKIESMLMDRILDTLIQRGAISEPKRNSKREIYYQMKKEVYESYIKFDIAERGN